MLGQSKYQTTPSTRTVSGLESKCNCSIFWRKLPHNGSICQDLTSRRWKNIASNPRGDLADSMILLKYTQTNLSLIFLHKWGLTASLKMSFEILSLFQIGIFLLQCSKNHQKLCEKGLKVIKKIPTQNLTYLYLVYLKTNYGLNFFTFLLVRIYEMILINFLIVLTRYTQ